MGKCHTIFQMKIQSYSVKVFKSLTSKLKLLLFLMISLEISPVSDILNDMS
jgi:uncharacterized metal-binding protein